MMRSAILIVTSCVASAAWAAPAPPAPAPAPTCPNAYAEDLSALSPLARDVEAHAPSYSYAVRTTATYECVSYGTDGNLKRERQVATAYGTAFGYRRDGADTLLLTNDHVASWPAVTDDDHRVDGVASGCKRVADSLAIVDNDQDDYAADDIALTRVVTDPQLDVAVLRAHAKLEILPWRIGKSSALTARVAVEVRGFPLGAFRATNVGKVISAYDHDDFGDWNHDDFVVDALLSHGNSGSPVLAVSCRTGEFELVGIYHANYTGGSALNVVIAIDQVRDLMTTLARSPRPQPEAAALDTAARARILDVARGHADPPFFTFGPLPASVTARADGTLLFSVYSADFPRVSKPLLVIEDRGTADASAFGAPGAVWVGGALGLQPFPDTDGDADAHAAVRRALDALRQDALATFDDRAGNAAATSRDAFEAQQRRRHAFDHVLAAQHDTAAAIVDLVGRTPAADQKSIVTMAQIEAAVPAPSPAP
jgi:serine protease Do